MSDQPICTDCRDSVLVTPVEQQYKICQTCLADQRSADQAYAERIH